MARAKAILAVASGHNYSQAARESGQSSGDTVASWVLRFNREGLKGIAPRHGGGARQRYSQEDRAKIVEIARSVPDPELDGTSNWTLNSLRQNLQRRELPTPSIYTLWMILSEAGLDWQDNQKSSRLSRSKSVRARQSVRAAQLSE